jgi:hypothetical protein
MGVGAGGACASPSPLPLCTACVMLGLRVPSCVYVRAVPLPPPSPLISAFPSAAFYWCVRVCVCNGSVPLAPWPSTYVPFKLYHIHRSMDEGGMVAVAVPHSRAVSRGTPTHAPLLTPLPPHSMHTGTQHLHHLPPRPHSPLQQQVGGAHTTGVGTRLGCVSLASLALPPTRTSDHTQLHARSRSW